MKFRLIYLFYTSIVVSLLSQLPNFVDNKITQYFQVVWLLPILGLLYKVQFKLNDVIVKMLVAILVLVFFVSFMVALDSNLYLKSPHLFNLIKSIFILIISYNFSFYENLDKFSYKLGWISLFTGIILCLGVYIHSFAEGFDVTSRVYAYAAKNSISQIILTCVVFAFFLIPSSNSFFGVSISIMKLLFILLSLYMLFILKSRATIFGITFFILLILSRNDVKPKLVLSILILLFILILISFSQLRNILFLSVLFAGRNVDDLNDVTSGRVDLYNEFPTLFLQMPITGHGFIFNESFPLSVLLDYGIFGGILVFFIVYIPIFYGKKMWCLRNDNFVAAYISIVLIYMFNSLFEQQAPLGPGVKNFMLWASLGFIMNYRISKEQARY